MKDSRGRLFLTISDGCNTASNTSHVGHNAEQHAAHRSKRQETGGVWDFKSLSEN